MCKEKIIRLIQLLWGRHPAFTLHIFFIFYLYSIFMLYFVKGNCTDFIIYNVYKKMDNIYNSLILNIFVGLILSVLIIFYKKICLSNVTKYFCFNFYFQ